MYNPVNQSDNNAEKIIGRDDNSRQYHTYLDNSKNSGTKAIVEIYLKILENSNKFLDDDTYHEITESLLRYKSPKSDMKDLRTKLSEASRSDLTDEALELKEFTSKFITRYEASDSGQFILVNILATIASNHRAYVIPAIAEGQPRSVIDAIIDTKVIGNTLNAIDGSGKAITSDRMYGLMYFLAGNCHIKWTV